MYDVYLFTGVHTLPLLEGWAASVPAIKDLTVLASFQEHIQQRTPHFLHLDLDAQTAIAVFQFLRVGKATGYILPAAYRQPRVSLEEATPIAEAALAEVKATHYPEQPTISVHFVREEPVCWVFSVTYSRNSRNYVSVDKLDGHIWPKSDLEHIWEMSYFLGDVARKMRVPYIVPTLQDDPQATYDIYLVRGAAKLPLLNDLISEALMLQDPALQQQMLQRNACLLKVALPIEKVLELLRRLEREGAWGAVLSSSYRHPRIAREEAAPIAEHMIARYQAELRPKDTLGPVRFFREEPCCWTFGASSEQLISEGHIPGMIFVQVDKLDGHVWTPEELERFTAED